MTPTMRKLRVWLREAERRGEISERIKAFIWLLAIEADDDSIESFMKGLE